MKAFPCIYSTIGHRGDEHRFVFLESSDPSDSRNIQIAGTALREYLTHADQFGPFTSLVIFSAPSTTILSIETYTQNHWNFLRALHTWDPIPWPKDVPSNVEDPAWQFNFAGEPVLPISLHPAYERRNSRRMSTHVIAVQPWRLLSELVSTPEKAQASSEKVRKLLKLYDDIPVCPDLKPFQDGCAVESRMLCLLDKNESSICPWPSLKTRC